MTNGRNAARGRKNEPPLRIPGLASAAPYSSRLSARSALYTELRLLLDGREDALASADYRYLVIEENCLARGSVSARRKLWKELHARYRLDAADHLFRAFWQEWCRSQVAPERSLTAYVLFALNDRLVTDLKLMKEPLRPERGVQTDSSILLIYPPEKELDFREQLVDVCLPALEAQGSRFHALDLTGFLFEGLGEDAVEALQEEEFDDYEWMLHGLSQRVEISLRTRLEELATEHHGDNLIVYGTVALYPLVRFGEILRGLRDLCARIAVAFPGEERGGKLQFMNQPDSGNYLAVKLFWQ